MKCSFCTLEASILADIRDDMRKTVRYKMPICVVCYNDISGSGQIQH